MGSSWGTYHCSRCSLRILQFLNWVMGASDTDLLEGIPYPVLTLSTPHLTSSIHPHLPTHYTTLHNSHMSHSHMTGWALLSSRDPAGCSSHVGGGTSAILGRSLQQNLFIFIMRHLFKPRPLSVFLFVLKKKSWLKWPFSAHAFKKRRKWTWGWI